MGQATPSANAPTYAQLEEIIRRKDRLLNGLYWSMEGLRAAAWMAHHAHDSGHPGYSEDEYAGSASHLFLLLATHTRSTLDDFSEAHRDVSNAVLSGQIDGEEARHG